MTTVDGTGTTGPVSIRDAVLIFPGRKRDDPEKWLEIRRTGIGGSDALSILSLSDRVDVAPGYESMWTIWARKLGLIGDREPTDDMVMGSAAEDVYAELWTRKTGVPTYDTGTWRSIAEPWRIANPDKLTPTGLGEIKHVVWTWRDWLNDHVPDSAYVQVLHYLDVLGLPEGDLIVVIGGRYPVSLRVMADPWLQGIIRDTQKIFWHEYVLPGIPPPHDGHKSTRAGLAELHPGTPEPTTIDLPPRAAATIADREQWRITRDHAATRMSAAENTLKSDLGSAHIGRLHGEPVCSWKPDVNGRRRLTIH